jgi:hypothetical protein
MRVDFMGRDERALTPWRFALHLWTRVTARTGACPVAVLWVHRRTVYYRLWPGVELWGRKRDARLYAGPWPVICHPPCGPWGVLAWNCRHQSKEDGIIAMRLVHKWGGVVEQPHTSRLFREYGTGRPVEVVDQADYGHRARKRTALYWVL